MKIYLIRIALALLTFISGVATMRLYVVDHRPGPPTAPAPENITVISPAAARSDPVYECLYQNQKALKQTAEVVFLKTESGFKIQILEPEGDYLALMKRGDCDYDHEANQYFTYQHDAIFMGIFDKAGSSYVYENGRFRSIVTSD